MDQINKKKSEDFNNPLTKEERALLLVEFLKEIGELETEGFGRFVVDVQDHHISNWWKISSRTARQFRKRLKNLTTTGTHLL